MSKNISVTFEGKNMGELVQKIFGFLSMVKGINTTGGDANDTGREDRDAEGNPQ